MDRSLLIGVLAWLEVCSTGAWAELEEGNSDHRKECMQRIKMCIAYDGTRFRGWQIQPAERTVQGVLEEALSRICNRPIRVHGSGRTDSGAHALGQVAHCDVPDARRGVDWRKALNALLPEDVAITGAEPVEPGFHARYSAVAKEYTYTLWTEPAFVLPQRAPFVWAAGEVDREAMLEAARVLEGRHDFAAFQNVGTPVSHTERMVYRIEPEPGFFAQETVWRIRADGFLKQMARVMMATLVAAGKGKFGPEGVRDLLVSGERSLAPATAPARGLCLESVLYGQR
jgi:tRNA pseudouridine38-40 synthase